MTITIPLIRKLYKGTPLTKYNIMNLYSTLNSLYQKGDYKNFLDNEHSLESHEIINDHDKMFRVHINVIENNSHSIYKHPRYINLLEGTLDINTTNSQLRLTKGSIFLNEEHSIHNTDKNTPCVIISHADLSKNMYDIALL